LPKAEPGFLKTLTKSPSAVTTHPALPSGAMNFLLAGSAYSARLLI
jgi:hypothetical protein